MSVSSESFHCLDVHEKRFDNTLVDLDLLLGGGLLYNSRDDDVAGSDDVEDDLEKSLRHKLATLSVCWSRLSHVVHTVCQRHAKLEAELVMTRDELAERTAHCAAVEAENEQLIRRLHSVQLQLHRSGTVTGSTRTQRTGGAADESQPEDESIMKQLENGLSDERRRTVAQWRQCPHCGATERRLCWLRDHVLAAVQAHLAASQLAHKYTQHQLAGRIQQFQMFKHGVDSAEHEDIWRRLQAEIRVHQHKLLAVQDYCHADTDTDTDRTRPANKRATPCCVEKIVLTKLPDESLGFSVTGGAELGAAICVSSIETDSAAQLNGSLYVGDIILRVNDTFLQQMSLDEAVVCLTSSTGDVLLEVLHHSSSSSSHHHDQHCHRHWSQGTDKSQVENEAVEASRTHAVYQRHLATQTANISLVGRIKNEGSHELALNGSVRNSDGVLRETSAVDSSHTSQ